MFGQALSFLSILFSSILLIQRKEQVALRIIIFGALLNIALNFWLIPKYSLYGAAWATVISEALNLVLLQWYAEWYKNWAMLAKMFTLVILNGLVLLTLKYFGQLNNLYLGGAILLTNLGVLFTVNLLEKQDLQLFLGPYLNKLKSLRS